MKRKIIIPLVILAVILGGFLLLEKLNQDIGRQLNKAEGEKFVEILINAPDKRTTQLVPPGLKEGQASETVGTAYRLIEDEKTYFAVLAILPDLKEGESYQAMIEDRFMGILSKNETGQWIAWRKDDQNLDSLKKVKVLRGEQVVLEGSF